MPRPAYVPSAEVLAAVDALLDAGVGRDRIRREHPEWGVAHRWLNAHIQERRAATAPTELPDVLAAHETAIATVDAETTTAALEAHIGRKVPPGAKALTLPEKFGELLTDDDGNVISKPMTGYWRLGINDNPSTMPDEDLAELRKNIRGWKPGVRRTPGMGLGPASNMLVNWADLQIGKGEGGGTPATVDRVHEGIENTQRRFKDLRRIGRNIEGTALANNGDIIENTSGHYAGQLHTVDLNLRGQLNVATDLLVLGAKEILLLGETADFISMPCNHTELGRGGGNKNQTGDSDSGGLYLAETLRRILNENGAFDHVRWHIPHDEMVVPVSLSGVSVAFSHAHKAPGNVIKWVDDQARVLIYEQDFKPRIFVCAHRHHYMAQDLGAYTFFQCPAQDGGSKWLKDLNGRWSRPGTLTMLVGEHDPRGFSDVEVL